MKNLVAVLSCIHHALNGYNQAMRENWLADVSKVAGLEYRFFVGDGTPGPDDAAIAESWSISPSGYRAKSFGDPTFDQYTPKDDEVVLHVPDKYEHGGYKLKEACRWGLDHGFDYIFSCLTDTYCVPERLLTSGFEAFDYLGTANTERTVLGGGPGIWMSKKAMQALVNAPVNHWAYDVWAAEVMARNGIELWHDTRYTNLDLGDTPPLNQNNIITSHISNRDHSTYDVALMAGLHHRYHSSILFTDAKMKIAVITPTLCDRSDLLEECKKSVRLQTAPFPVFHAVAIDTRRRGSGNMRNRIVYNLSPDYDWLAFVDDDDILLPDHLRLLAEASQNADIIYSETQTVGFSWPLVIGPFNRERLFRENFIPVTVLMRRSVFEKAGGFRNCWVEDHDLWKRCAELGARFAYVPQVTWQYRQLPSRPRKSIIGEKKWNRRVLISIASYEKAVRDGKHQMMRDTFLKHLSKFQGLEYKFFIGDGTPTGDDESILRASFSAPDAKLYQNKSQKCATPFSYAPQNDERILAIPDDYMHVAYKIREGHRWGLQNGFDFIFQCFIDTYIDLQRLVDSGFEDYDYVGSAAGTTGYASGGSGYCLSRRASQYVVNSPVTDWADDRWVGAILSNNGILLHDDRRYGTYPIFPKQTNDCITSHLSVTPSIYNPNLMKTVYDSFE